MTQRQAHPGSTIGKIQTTVNHANQELRNLNGLTNPVTKANTAVACKTQLLQAIAELEQVARQQKLPVPDSFWTTGPSDLPAVSEPEPELPQDKERMQSKFTARFPDECASESCMEDLEGTRVVKTNHDRLWHEQCWALEASS